VIVVDTNVIGYLYLASAHSSQAEQALLRDPLWAAPLPWRSELRNVLALYIRRAFLSLHDSHQIMDEAESLLRGREYHVSSREVLGLAAASGCSAYDCEFVTLARDLAVPLVTVDAQILGHFPSVAVSPEAFAGVPD